MPRLSRQSTRTFIDRAPSTVIRVETVADQWGIPASLPLTAGLHTRESYSASLFVAHNRLRGLVTRVTAPPG
jgi:hypothetical protein